jgi:hypothetical protein
MARKDGKDGIDGAEKIRVLRDLAFHIHRKRPAAEALTDYIDAQGQLGRRREIRPAAEALAQDGFLAAILALGLVGDETAAVLASVIDAEDHRLLAKTLVGLADHLDERSRS